MTCPAESVWCLPLILDTFFSDPADFPHLTTFGLAAHWSDERIPDLRKITRDTRLRDLRLDGSEGSCMVTVKLLQALVERLTLHPRSIDEFHFPAYPYDPTADPALPEDPLVDEIRKLILDVIRFGRDGLVTFVTLEYRLMDGPKGEAWRPSLMEALRANDWLEYVNLPTQDGDDPFLIDIGRRYRWNSDRSYVGYQVAKRLVAPAAVLLAPRTKDCSDPSLKGTILSLPAEIIDLILHELADTIAYAYESVVWNDSNWAAAEPFEHWSAREWIDGRLSLRQIRNVLVWASEIGTNGRDRDHFLGDVDCQRWEPRT